MQPCSISRSKKIGFYFLLAVLLQLSSVKGSTKLAATPIYTIPVVFHILHMGGTENISDQQVLDAINILNQDYQATNPDVANVVASYTNNIADVQFHFQLAGKDPNGNCTNGIIRHFTPHTVWDAADFNYFAYSWPRANYLNIYVVKNMTAPSGAYTFFPGSLIPADADAIVILNSCCGSIGTSNPGNSRWLTQKVGHWFNLQHTWGLSNTIPTVCGDDGVADTPPTKGFLTCATASANLCNSAIQENVQNFMDASPCPCMFTNGQKARMHACINSPTLNRSNLSSPANLLATGITSSTNNCIPLVDVSATPNTTVCVGTPLTINAFTSNAVVTSYSWTANNNVTITNPTLATTGITFGGQGNSTITCVASNSNGAATASMVVYAVSNIANIGTYNSESFELAGIPANWQIINPATPATSWTITNLAASHGTNCMMVNAETAPGSSEETLQSPSYDFGANPGSRFTFKYAYARQSNQHNDVFKVQASKDCGSTWKDIYVPSAAVMATGSGETNSTLFVPDISEWKTYTLSSHPNFASFLNENNVLIRFYFKEDTAGYGNRLYLDQINFEVPTGIEKHNNSIRFVIYPNPAQSQITLAFELSDEKQMGYAISDINGRTVLVGDRKTLPPGKHQIQLEDNHLQSGMYFINLELDGLKYTKKLVIE